MPKIKLEKPQGHLPNQAQVLPSANTDSETQPSSLAYVVLSCYITWLVVDFIFDSELTKSSCGFTIWLQKIFGLGMKNVAEILTSPMSHWIIIFMMLLPVVTDNYITTLHYYTLHYAQLCLVVMLKASYGRARGTITCQESIAIECSCDFGMPSGHSSSGCMGYLILLDLIDRRYFDTHLSATKKRNPVRLFLYLLGFLIIFSIMISRVY